MSKCTRVLLAAAGLALSATCALAQTYPAVPLFETDKTVLGETFAYPPGHSRVTAAIVILAPGETTIRHRHGAPFFAYILEGEITVDYGAQGTRVYKAGDAFMEAMAVEHAGSNKGTTPVRLLGVYMGADGAQNVEAHKD
ncbi:MAG: hypothetical protein JWN07_383 [Hyphomicrobiales bacterium]|nr:hypothetical protein [Hyphomicrobiales bacterium]